MKKIKGQPWLDDILMSATSPATVSTAQEQLADLLRARHHIRPGAPDDFNLRNPTEIAETLAASARTMEGLLASVASVSLLIGGVGIMNIMLVSVSERTREIGLRLAIGARHRDVLRQFLWEAIVLPAWGAPPPSYLLTRRAQDIWRPLALLDYGDEPFPFSTDALLQRRPVGANVAFRRDVIEAVGGWRTDLRKVNNTLMSGEDHEIFFRLLRAGQYRGVYDPRISVVHDVPASRLRRSYVRRWFFFSGLTRANARRLI